MKQSRQGVLAVEQVGTALPNGIDALDHLIGLVIGVLSHGGAFVVAVAVELAVLLLDQIAPAIVGVNGALLVVGAVALLDKLIEVVDLVVVVDIVVVALVGQVAQGVILVVPVGVAVELLGRGDPVQLVIGVGDVGGGLAGAVAPHILVGHVAADVVGKGVLLLLHVLAAGVGVLNGKELADGVVVVVLLPAVGVVHVGDPAHTVIGVGGGAAILLHHLGEVVDQIVLLGGGGAVGVGHAGLVAHAVVGIGNVLAQAVGGGGDAVEQVDLVGGGAAPVLHLHQVAGLVVGVVHLLTTIVIDMAHQVKGIEGVLGDHAVGVGGLDQIAVAVVLMDGDMAQSVHHLGLEAPAIVLVQGDLVLVHIVLGIHTVERYCSTAGNSSRARRVIKMQFTPAASISSSSSCI